MSDPEALQELSALVKQGIEENRKSSAKWNELYDWLAEHFGVDKSKIRASLLAELGNITNRVFKDNAWENPEILVLVCVEQITVEIAAPYVDSFVSTFHARMDVLPRLRLVLIFDNDQLKVVKKLTAAPAPAGRTSHGATPESGGGNEPD